MDLNEDSINHMERSLLDIAIVISLNILELILHYRIIEGKDVPISKREADDVDDGIWEKFIERQNRTALKYLKMIGRFE